jgi:predicted ATP-grasp superfamily ATP-dependent carboligase
MKKLILLLLVAFSITACSQELNKPVLCLETKEMFDSIFEDYKETLLMVFDQDTFPDNKIALTVNTKSKTWSLIEYNSSLACLLGSGVDYKVMGRTLSKDYL